MEDVIHAIKKYKIISIVRGVPLEKILPMTEALYKGGIRLIEVTFNQSSENCLFETMSAIREINKSFDKDLFVGAGTVITTEQVNSAKEAGARYIISPNIDKEIMAQTLKKEMLSIPGTFTPSEIVDAYKNGASFVKVFPGSLLGTDYLKAIHAPLNHIPLIIVGGVDKNNMADFLLAGASGFGIGGNLVNKKMIDNNDYEGLTALAREFTSQIAEE